MNNARFIDEEDAPVDNTVVLRERQTEITRIIEAINALSKIPEWQTLKELVFDGQLEKLEKSLQIESKKNELNAPEIYRLNGQLLWAKRYSDLYKLAEAYKLELKNINQKLNENVPI